MTRKQHKSVLNYASRNVGRKAANALYGNRNNFVKFNGMFVHKMSCMMFVV